MSGVELDPLASVENFKEEVTPLVAGYGFELKEDMVSALQKALNKILASKERYEEMERKTGVPWQLIGAIHYREGRCNFKTYLHNGQRLGKRTTIKPKGVLFHNWEEAAEDALETYLPSRGDGSFNDLLNAAEGYNGYGYRGKGIKSPYIWAGTNLQQQGLYVGDGRFKEDRWDHTPGVAPILAILLEGGGATRRGKRENPYETMLTGLDKETQAEFTSSLTSLETNLLAQEVESKNRVYEALQLKLKNHFTPEKIAEITGVSAEELTRIGNEEEPTEADKRKFITAVAQLTDAIDDYTLSEGYLITEPSAVNPNRGLRNLTAGFALGWYGGALGNEGIKRPLTAGLALGVLGMTGVAAPIMNITERVARGGGHMVIKLDTGVTNFLRNVYIGGEQRNLETGYTDTQEIRKMIAEGIGSGSVEKLQAMPEFIAPEIRGFFKEKILNYTPPEKGKPMVWSVEEIQSAARFCVRCLDKNVYSSFEGLEHLNSFEDWAPSDIQNVSHGFVTMEAGTILRHFLAVESKENRVEGRNGSTVKAVFIKEFSAYVAEKREQDEMKEKKTLEAYLATNPDKKNLTAFTDEELQEMFPDLAPEKLAMAQHMGVENFFEGGLGELLVGGTKLMGLVFGIIYGKMALDKGSDALANAKDKTIDAWTEGKGAREILPIKAQNKISTLLAKQNPDNKDVLEMLNVLVSQKIINGKIRKQVMNKMVSGTNTQAKAFFAKITRPESRFKKSYSSADRSSIARDFAEDIQSFAGREKDWVLAKLRASHESFHNRLHPKGGFDVRFQTKEKVNLSLSNCKKLVPAEISAGGLNQWIVNSSARIKSLGLQQKDIFKAQSVSDRNMIMVMTRNPNGKIYIHKLAGKADPTDPLGKRRLWGMTKRYEVTDMQLA